MQGAEIGPRPKPLLPCGPASILVSQRSSHSGKQGWCLDKWDVDPDNFGSIKKIKVMLIHITAK